MNDFDITPHDTVIRRFPNDGVRVIRRWLPAHSSYYRMLGVFLREDARFIHAQVYGCWTGNWPCPVVAVRLLKPLSLLQRGRPC